MAKGEESSRNEVGGIKPNTYMKKSFEIVYSHLFKSFNKDAIRSYIEKHFDISNFTRNKTSDLENRGTEYDVTEDFLIKLLKLAVEGFFYNDLMQATRILMSKAKGSFGVAAIARFK